MVDLCCVILSRQDMCVIHCIFCCLVFFFFFKQKTAYEMRISDWSSDVCSSDLAWFRADTKYTTGLSSWCGSCENRIYWENRASRLEYTRARYRRMAEEEVETLRNWRRRWREANPEKQKASEKRWQEENRELHLKSKIKIERASGREKRRQR